MLATHISDVLREDKITPCLRHSIVTLCVTRSVHTSMVRIGMQDRT